MSGLHLLVAGGLVFLHVLRLLFGQVLRHQPVAQPRPVAPPSGSCQIFSRKAMPREVSIDFLLPADNISGDLSADSRSGFTSPTNIGAYLWSTVTARDLGLISAEKAD